MWTVSYRIKHVDHMDVTTEYETEGKARAVFDSTKEFRDLKFVRLEDPSFTVVDFFRPE